MASRELSYSEYEERVRSEGCTGNVGGLWNALAGYFHGYHVVKRSGEPAKCTLPVGELIKLVPAEAKKLPRIGAAQFKVYQALYRSLMNNSAQLRDRSLDITREGLGVFAPPSRSKVFVTTAWKGCSSRGSAGSLTVGQIEEFCTAIRGGEQPPRGFHEEHLRLIEAWLKHLKGHP